MSRRIFAAVRAGSGESPTIRGGARRAQDRRFRARRAVTPDALAALRPDELLRDVGRGEERQGRRVARHELERVADRAAARAGRSTSRMRWSLDAPSTSTRGSSGAQALGRGVLTADRADRAAALAAVLEHRALPNASCARRADRHRRLHLALDDRRRERRSRRCAAPGRGSARASPGRRRARSPRRCAGCRSPRAPGRRRRASIEVELPPDTSERAAELPLGGLGERREQAEVALVGTIAP